jgi:hypothetical protein
MSDSTDLTETITQTASEPASAMGDGQSATGQRLTDLIEADRYLATKKAGSQTGARGRRRSAFACLRPAQASPPGAA